MVLPKDAYEYGERSDGETHGLVLTKPHIVELILDLAGYEARSDLAKLRILEPSCGEGAFLVPAVTRLMESAKRHKVDAATLLDAVLAFDIDDAHVAVTRGAIAAELRRHGVNVRTARKLSER